MKKQNWFRRHPVLTGIIIIFIILCIHGIWRENWEEENCDLTFYTYTYNDDCASACSSKCSNEDFPHRSSSYFYEYLSYDEMIDVNLYKKCECNCGGCRGE